MVPKLHVRPVGITQDVECPREADQVVRKARELRESGRCHFDRYGRPVVAAASLFEITPHVWLNVEHNHVARECAGSLKEELEICEVLPHRRRVLEIRPNGIRFRLATSRDRLIDHVVGKDWNDALLGRILDVVRDELTVHVPGGPVA